MDGKNVMHTDCGKIFPFEEMEFQLNESEGARNISNQQRDRTENVFTHRQPKDTLTRADGKYL